MDIKTLLDKEIQDEFKTLKDLDVGTEEYKVTVDGLAKLMEKRAEIQKLEAERAEKAQQAEVEKNTRIVGYIMTGAGILLPVAVTIWGTLTTLKYEETGTITTTAGRNFFNRLFAKK